MAKQLIINQTLNECRAALMENGEILDFLMERTTEGVGKVPHVGDIFKGKVVRVLPGMQSAFIDIFSCKEFYFKSVTDFTMEFYGAQEITIHTGLRGQVELK